MRLCKPDYYDQFQCIAGACKDSCCIGWEIDVDEEKREFYRQTEGLLGERMKRNINWEEGHFILQGKEERCPFLNRENLCDLILELGEDSLCEICREHPRFYEWYEDLTEAGLGLCCEEAARLIVTHKGAVRFEVEYQANDDCMEKTLNESKAFNESDEICEDGRIDESDAEWLDALFAARETAYAILQNRRHSIWERLVLFLEYTEELQDALEFEFVEELLESAEYYQTIVLTDGENRKSEMADTSGQREESDENNRISVYHFILQCCQKLEAMDSSWPEKLHELDAMLAEPEAFLKTKSAMDDMYAERDEEYEQIAVYLVYRYFMKCRMDGDIYSKGCLTVFFVILVYLLDVVFYQKHGVLTVEERVWHAKQCSKEIEYNEENLENLAELFWEHGFSHFLFTSSEKQSMIVAENAADEDTEQLPEKE